MFFEISMWNCDAIEQDIYRDNNVDGDDNENVTKQGRSKTFRKETQSVASSEGASLFLGV